MTLIRSFSNRGILLLRLGSVIFSPVLIRATHTEDMDQKDRLIDSYSPYEREVAHLRHLDETIPEFAWRILARFRPQVPPAQWRVVREFVITVAMAMKPRTPENVRRIMTMVSRYTVWIWATTGRDLEVATVFTDELIRRYIAEQLGSHSYAHRFAVTRQLGTVAESLADNRVHRMRPPESSELMVPYADAEVATMHSWASSLPTALKRRNARAILGLSGGAGLTSAEVVDARVEHIGTIDGRLVVNVQGERPRQVPVLAAWTRTLARSVEGRNSGSVFHGYRLDEYPPRTLQTFLTEHRGPIRPSPRQLRLTWIIKQIDANLPLTVLLEISGFSTPAGLEPYLRHTRTYRTSDYFAHITGEVTR